MVLHFLKLLSFQEEITQIIPIKFHCSDLNINII